MKTASVPIIKIKTGDSSDKINYMPMALVTAAPKIFVLCLSEISGNYLFTYDQILGLKANIQLTFAFLQ